MTSEEVAELIQEVSAEIDRLPEDPEKPLTKGEKIHKQVLQLRKETLIKIQAAKEKGNLTQEVRAGMDYVLLCKYGEKHPFLMNLLKSQLGWYGF